MGFLEPFAGVVKGCGSLRGKTVTWKEVAHQMVKAYDRTCPDHVLVVLTKDPVDSVLSELGRMENLLEIRA